MQDFKILIKGSPTLQTFPPAILVHVERLVAMLPQEKRAAFFAVLEREQKENEKTQGKIRMELKQVEQELGRLIREAEETYLAQAEQAQAEQILTDHHGQTN